MWINLHGGWPQGMAMLVAFLGARVAMDVRHRWLGKNAAHVPHDHLPWRHLAVVLAVCGGALFINPYGARLVYFPLEMQAPWIRALGEEWKSPLTLIWSVWGVGIRELVVLSYLALLAGVLLLMTWRWRTADVVPIAVMGLWLALSLWHLRALSDTVLLTAPFIAAAWPPAWWRGRSWPTLAGSSLLLGPAALVLGSVVATWVAPPMGGFLCVVATMERLQLFGHVYMQRNSWADNTLLLYWFHPKILVQQTWEYVMGPAHMAELHEIVKEGGMFLQSHLDHYEVDTVVLTTGMFWRSAPGQRRLPGWVFVHMENSFVVMVRQTAAAGMPQYDIIRPWDHIPVTPDNAHRVLEESTRALQQCPDGATFAWAYHATALYALGRHEEAGEAKRKVPEQIVLE